MRTSLMVRFPRVALAAVLAVGACHDHDKPVASDVDEYFWDCENPNRPSSLTTFATDESLIALLNKESAGAVRTVDENAATLALPPSGATISAATPPTFVVQPPATSAQAPTPEGVPKAYAGVSPAPTRPLWRRALGWLSPIGTAHAHCLPVTGDNYLVRLIRDGDAKPVYSALLSLQTFTPSPAIWTKAMQGRAGQTLKVTIIRAFYSGGSITDGPFVGSQTATLVVGP